MFYGSPTTKVARCRLRVSPFARSVICTNSSALRPFHATLGRQILASVCECASVCVCKCYCVAFLWAVSGASSWPVNAGRASPIEWGPREAHQGSPAVSGLQAGRILGPSGGLSAAAARRPLTKASTLRPAWPGETHFARLWNESKTFTRLPAGRPASKPQRLTVCRRLHFCSSGRRATTSER